jgi:hypothetical protein
MKRNFQPKRPYKWEGSNVKLGSHSVGVREGEKGRGEMTVARIFGKVRKRTRTPDPDYMKTDRFDGRRSVDREKFLDNERVKEQIKELAESART